MKKQKAPAPRTPEEKLRGLVNLKIQHKSFYTQKELGALLGISERTIRRFKNQKGYILAPATLKRLRAPLGAEDRKLKRLLDAGGAIMMKVTTVRGVKRRRPVLVKDKSLKQPPSRVLQLPVIYTSKSGESQTIMTNVLGWSTEQKIDFLESAHHEKRFGSWHARVMVPPGVGRSGRKGEGELVNDEPEEIEDEDTGEITVQNPKPEYYMIGPFALTGNRPKMRSEIMYHEDAGRVIVEIYLVENIKPKRKGKNHGNKK